VAWGVGALAPPPNPQSPIPNPQFLLIIINNNNFIKLKLLVLFIEKNILINLINI